jgi:hypothetical protein
VATLVAATAEAAEVVPTEEAACMVEQPAEVTQKTVEVGAATVGVRAAAVARWMHPKQLRRERSGL